MRKTQKAAVYADAELWLRQCCARSSYMRNELIYSKERTVAWWELTAWVTHPKWGNLLVGWQREIFDPRTPGGAATAFLRAAIRLSAALPPLDDTVAHLFYNDRNIDAYRSRDPL